MNLRPGFNEIANGWLLVDDWDDLTERIERLADWTKLNGPLSDDESATVRFMIARQIASAPSFLIG